MSHLHAVTDADALAVRVQAARDAHPSGKAWLIAQADADLFAKQAANEWAKADTLPATSRLREYHSALASALEDVANAVCLVHADLMQEWPS